MPQILFFTVAASLVTHVYTAISNGEWGLLVGGLAFPPLGVVHGIYTWFF